MLLAKPTFNKHELLLKLDGCRPYTLISITTNQYRFSKNSIKTPNHKGLLIPALKQRLTIFLLLFFTNLSIIGCDQRHQPTSSFEVTRVGMHSASISSQGEYALLGSIYDGASLWQLPNNERLYDWNHRPKDKTVITSSDFSPDSHWAVSASANDLVLWNTETGEGVRYWSAPAEILDIALGPKARFALLGLENSTAVVFDIQKGGILRTLGHNNRVRSVALSDDGSIALTGSEDFTAKAWSIESGRAMFTQQHKEDVQLVQLSQDGQIALSVSKYDSAKIWRTSDGTLVNDIPLKAEFLKRGLRFTAARFNSDNTRLLTGRPDGWVELWELQTQYKLSRWKLPKRSKWKPSGAAVLDVAFNNESQFYAVASNGLAHLLVRPDSP